MTVFPMQITFPLGVGYPFGHNREDYEAGNWVDKIGETKTLMQMCTTLRDALETIAQLHGK